MEESIVTLYFVIIYSLFSLSLFNRLLDVPRLLISPRMLLLIEEYASIIVVDMVSVNQITIQFISIGYHNTIEGTS